MNEVEEMAIDTMVDDAETISVVAVHHLQDAAMTTVDDKILIAGTEAIMTPLAGNDHGHLIATDVKTRTDTEAQAHMDVVVKTRLAISSTSLDATEATSLMFRFL